MQNKTELSVSVVVYRTDLKDLEIVFSDFKKSAMKFCKENEASISFYLVDNSEDWDYHLALSNLINKWFFQNSTISAQLIRSKNIGYGRANNIAITNSEAPYHLVMNPDVYLSEDALFLARNYLEQNPKVGMLTPAIYSLGGERIFLCRRQPGIGILILRRFMFGFLRKKLEKKMFYHEMRDKNYDEIIDDVPFPSGCFMFFRTAFVRKLGGFDERYFMYFEDLDLARRMRQFAAIHYVPTVSIKHQWARGSYKKLKLFHIHISSAVKYFWKWRKARGI